MADEGVHLVYGFIDSPDRMRWIFRNKAVDYACWAADAENPGKWYW